MSESDVIADRHLAIARRAIALMRPRGVKRRRAAPGMPARRPQTPGQPAHLFPTLGEAFATVCRRAECRRAFACVFGTRAGEHLAEDAAPPCWQEMPRR